MLLQHHPIPVYDGGSRRSIGIAETGRLDDMALIQVTCYQMVGAYKGRRHMMVGVVVAES